MPNPCPAPPPKAKPSEPGQLLLMLYDGAIRFNQQAIQSLEQGRPLDSLVPMGRTLAIVQELQARINPKCPTDLCIQLDRLYGFIQEQIATARREKKSKPLRNVAMLLKCLRKAWIQAIQTCREQAGLLKVG